jgi:molybdopterin synthase sulfur carrier subunit
MANLIIPTPLRKFTNNTATIKTEGSTVKEAIADLINQYPDLQKHLLDEAGEIRSFVRIFVGDDDILGLKGNETEVASDSTISIIPAIAGGIN